MVLLTNIWAKEIGMVAGAFTITHCLVSGATLTFTKIRISESAGRHGPQLSRVFYCNAQPADQLSDVFRSSSEVGSLKFNRLYCVRIVHVEVLNPFYTY